MMIAWVNIAVLALVTASRIIACPSAWRALRIKAVAINERT